MICIGDLTEVKARLEQIVDKYFPNGLSNTDVVSIACEYEQLLNRR
ncbi:MAG: hypothetical protein KIG65_03895 [Eubacteriales bacterium]|nr:hypothetical protein [Eubacteriales bacterium]